MRFEILVTWKKGLMLSLRRTKARPVQLARALIVIAACVPLAFAFPYDHDPVAENTRYHEGAEEVSFLNTVSAPVQINNANLIKSGSTRKLVLSVSNLTNEPVPRVVFSLFCFSSSGRLKRSEDISEPIDLEVNSNKLVSILLLNEIEEGERLAVAIRRVIVSHGAWEVNAENLRDAVKAKAEGRLNSIPAAHYEKNPVITEAEKSELLASSMRRILGDKSLLKYLSIKDHTTVLLSLKNVGEKSVKVPGVNITFIEPEDIQGKANQEGEIFYFEVDGLKSEGGRAVVVISYNVRAKLDRTFTPCCGSVVFYYQKTNEKWEETDTKIYPL